MKNSTTYVYLIIIFLLLSACSKNVDVAGSGSDTEIIGVVMQNNTPVDKAIVTLADSTSVVSIDTTKSDGSYLVKAPRSGSYTITAQKGDSSIANISITISTESSFTADTLVLDSSVTVTVVVPSVNRAILGDSLYLSCPPFPALSTFEKDSLYFSIASSNQAVEVYGSYQSSWFMIDTIFPSTNKKIVAGQKVEVLFLFDTSSISQELAPLLQDTFTTITTIALKDFVPQDTLNIDCIYFAADVDTLFNYTKLFKNCQIPLVVTSNKLTQPLGLQRSTDSIGVDISRNTIVRQIHGTLPVGTVLNNVLELFNPSGSTEIEWSESSGNCTTILESNVHPSGKYFYIYTQNDTLADLSIASHHRIGLFGSTTTLPNSMGISIIKRTIRWTKEISSLES